MGATVLEAIKEPVAKGNKIADEFVEKFERRHPTSKGAIPKEPHDRAIFLLYLTVFLMVCLRVLSFGKSIFCCIFCCCCRKSGGKKETKKFYPKEKTKPKMKK